MFYQQFPFLCVMQELSGWLGGLSWKGRAVLAPDLQRHLHGIALRKATAFNVFPSSSLIFVLYCESWVREEAGRVGKGYCG